MSDPTPFEIRLLRPTPGTWNENDAGKTFLVVEYEPEKEWLALYEDVQARGRPFRVLHKNDCELVIDTTLPFAHAMVIAIGNSDDKLTQREWSEYVARVKIAVEKYAAKVHFFGFPPADAPWQNAVWSLVPNSPIDAKHLTRELTTIRQAFRQESIAVITGKTAFI